VAVVAVSLLLREAIPIKITLFLIDLAVTVVIDSLYDLIGFRMNIGVLVITVTLLFRIAVTIIIGGWTALIRNAITVVIEAVNEFLGFGILIFIGVVAVALQLGEAITIIVEALGALVYDVITVVIELIT